MVELYCPYNPSRLVWPKDSFRVCMEPLKTPHDLTKKKNQITTEHVDEMVKVPHSLTNSLEFELKKCNCVSLLTRMRISLSVI